MSDLGSRERQPQATGHRLLEAAAVGVGVVAALVLLVVLVRLVPAYLDEEPITGALLLIAGALLVLPVFDLWSPLRRRGMWLVGAGAALGLALVYGVSRAFGVPGPYDAAWRDTWALAGLACVAVYLLAMAVWFWAAGEAAPRTSPTTRRPRRSHTWRPSPLT